MELCSFQGHEEVCYDGSHCPVCTVTEEKDEEIKEQAGVIEELQTSVKDLEGELDEARNVWQIP